MSLVGGISLASRMAGSLGHLLVDRVEEALGRALPRTPEQLANADVVNALIRDHGPSGVADPLPPIRSVRPAGVEFESSNCRNFLLELEFEPGLEGADTLPRTLYAKLPCDEIATRAFANAVGFWQLEEAFCEHVSTQVPIRVPRVHAVARRGARFVLLLENLRESPGVRLFINRDMAAGTTPERARMCLRTFAELHAAFWGWSREEQNRLIPESLHIYLSPGGRARTRALNALSIGPAHRAAPETFTAEHAEIFRRATLKWDALIDSWYEDPLTLIHGDSHLANCFEYATPDGPRMGMLDFQGMHWCPGIRDVQYFLINSMDPELLAAHESELIDFYVGELRSRGVALDPGKAREQYRAFAFQTLMVAVTSLGLGSLTELDSTLHTILERSVAAIDRLEFSSWLDAL